MKLLGGGGETDWVGKEWAGLLFPQGKNGPAHPFPGEKTDWAEIPACYSGTAWFIGFQEFTLSDIISKISEPRISANIYFNFRNGLRKQKLKYQLKEK